MAKDWKDLPVFEENEKIELSPREMMESLSSVVAEFVTKTDYDQSVRLCEYPLLKSIQAGWQKKEFGPFYIKSMQIALKNYVRCGQDKEAVKIACSILGQSAEVLRQGAIATAVERKRKKGASDGTKEI